MVVVASVPLARAVGVLVKRSFKRAGIASGEVAADFARIAKWLVYLLAIALAASILGLAAWRMELNAMVGSQWTRSSSADCATIEINRHVYEEPAMTARRMSTELAGWIQEGRP